MADNPLDSSNTTPDTSADAQQPTFQPLNAPRDDSSHRLRALVAPNRTVADRTVADTQPVADVGAGNNAWVIRERADGTDSTKIVSSECKPDENWQVKQVQPDTNRGKSDRRKWVVMGVGLTIVGIISAVALGFALARKSGEKPSSPSLSPSPSSTPSNSPTANGTVPNTSPNDPSTFVKDPNLHQSFYGIAYTPVGSQLPDCGSSLSAVIQDIQILSQLTQRIRLYSADCNQTALVLEAIKQTKVEMTVFIGNSPSATDNGASYRRQRDVLKTAIQTYGTNHIGGVLVGNEFMLNYVINAGTLDLNGALAGPGAQMLISFIQDTRNTLSEMGVKLPVGTSDGGYFLNNRVLQSVDYGMATVKPWSGNISATDAAGWTAKFFQEGVVALAQAQPNKPPMYIAEIGWPTKSSNIENANNGASPASIPNLQVFLDTFVCQANMNNTGYFFFEFCDEDWQDKYFGGVEGWWGLFNQNRTLKSGITIPSCAPPGPTAA